MVTDMLSLDQSTQREILDILTFPMERPGSRRGLLELALGQNAPILDRIDFEGPVKPFILNMLHELIGFGEIKHV